MSTRFARIVLASAAALCFLVQVPAARSETILAFGQSGSNKVQAIRTGSSTVLQTTTASPVSVTVTNLAGTAVNLPAYFHIDAVSAGAATVVGGVVTQTFTGYFNIDTTPAQPTGPLTPPAPTNYLSGTFTATLFGFVGGTSASLVSQPGSITYYSNQLPIGNYVEPLAFSVSFSGLSSPLGVTSNSINSFNAQSAGTFSGALVPEPSSVMSFAIGTLGMIGYGLRRLRVRNV